MVVELPVRLCFLGPCSSSLIELTLLGVDRGMLHFLINRSSDGVLWVFVELGSQARLHLRGGVGAFPLFGFLGGGGLFWERTLKMWCDNKCEKFLNSENMICLVLCWLKIVQ